MMSVAALTGFIAALFSMMNPIGFAGIFAGMTADRTDTQARKIAWTCATTVAVTLVALVWSGDVLLRFFGITVDTIRASGGIVVLLVGLQMVLNDNSSRQSKTEEEEAMERESIAIVPLGIPIVAGPGAMATVLVAADDAKTFIEHLELSLVIIGMATLTGFIFSYAGPIAQRLGESGLGAVTRIMGMVLSAIAMGMLAEGLKGLMPGLAG